MELITTHIGADFDALASMIAARRLHPGASLFFPGSREESVRRALEAGLISFSELKHKQVEPAALRRVMLCDVRQPSRLGIVADWLAAHPAAEVWAYDHHPPADGDLAVAGGVVDPAVGATSTLMVEELRRWEIRPRPGRGDAIADGDPRGHRLADSPHHLAPRLRGRGLAARPRRRPRRGAPLRRGQPGPGPAGDPPPHDPRAGGLLDPRPAGGGGRSGAGRVRRRAGAAGQPLPRPLRAAAGLRSLRRGRGGDPDRPRRGARRGPRPAAGRASPAAAGMRPRRPRGCARDRSWRSASGCSRSSRRRCRRPRGPAS